MHCDVYEEAADKAGIPGAAREEMVHQCRDETRRRIVRQLADAIHEAFMDKMAREGK